MAEAVLFSLGSKILSTIASPAFQMAYEKGVSIWEAKDELAKLQVTIQAINAVLLDAEKKQESSAAVKDWTKRLKSVLYDAEDLFDEVATDDLLNQQMMEEGSDKLSLKKKVQVSCSKLNPIVSRNSIAKKVKAIRKNLVDISTDMAQFDFARCQGEKPRLFVGKRRDPGCFVDARDVIGRDEDKKVILKMLVDEFDSDKSDNPAIIAIVGIGGMGKTILAQLMYNDEEVRENFEKRWFTCISDISDEREVLGKIFQSICGGGYSDLDVGQLQINIRESIVGKKYLLVLDDVWEDDRSIWHDRLSLLSSHATGCRIIITTRLPSVAKAVGALGSHNLKGLSEDDSWSLFRRFAFVGEYENDKRRESLGREILKKCSGVPLAIRSIGSLLFSNNTIREWEAIEKEDLPTLGRNYNDKTMSVLKLSYDHLPSYLKHCFAYCCMFPKDRELSKGDLIYHWIAQGYIKPNDEEFGFMHLLRRGFFQEVEEDEYGEIKSCKMHDLMHDLALYVAGEESIVLSSTSSNISSSTRRVSCWLPERAEPWDILKLMLNAKSIRSLLLTKMSQYRIESSKLDQLLASVKLLRTLSFSRLKIENIPPSIGKLKLMRYLDLSYNSFKELPHSITNLVNLLSLNMERCDKFNVWPLNFHKLINLRYLNVKFCYELRLMPVGIGGMTKLQYLSDFKIEKESGFNASIGLLQQLRGRLSIQFMSDIWEASDICNWQLPVSLHHLDIYDYQGMRIPGWGNTGSTNNLACLRLIRCTNVKYLPPLSCLPNLRKLVVSELPELEFMEEGDCTDYNFATSKFFPCLVELCLRGLPKLNRWWEKVVAEVTSPSAFVEFPLLRRLEVESCPKFEFKSLPLCVHIQQVEEKMLSDWEIQEEPPSTISCTSSTPSLEEITSRCKWQSSLTSLRRLKFFNCSALKSLHLDSPHLQEMYIEECNELMSIKLDVAQHLQKVWIKDCCELKNIELVKAHTPTSSLRELTIERCEELKSLHIPAHFIVVLKKWKIIECLKLRLAKSALPSPTVLNIDGCSWTAEMKFDNVGGELIEQLSLLPVQYISMYGCMGPIRFMSTPFTSVRRLSIEYVDGLEILQLASSPHLERLSLRSCRKLTSIEVEAPSSIIIKSCRKLKNLRIAYPNSLIQLIIKYPISGGVSMDWDFISNLGECCCIRDMNLQGVGVAFIERLISLSASSLQDIEISEYERPISFMGITLPSLTRLCIDDVSLNEGFINDEVEASSFVGWIRGVNWNSLPNLRILMLHPFPSLHKLPQCLLQRQVICQLKIIGCESLHLSLPALIQSYILYLISYTPSVFI